MVGTLAKNGERRLDGFEAKNSLELIVSTVDSLEDFPSSESIARYQQIIRSNYWYFPVTKPVELDAFLIRWDQVHEHYHDLAEEVFTLLRKKGFQGLADYKLLQKAVHSETMRGWVGKRSPSGLDAMLDSRMMQLEKILDRHDDVVVDAVFSSKGVYSPGSGRDSAEREMLNRLYECLSEDESGNDLSLSDSNVTQILRNFCRYSVAELNNKLLATDAPVARISVATESDALVADRAIDSLGGDERDHALLLLDEIRVLNFINLNLEVKFSFKGWAGFMHVLVFEACSRATGIDTDVYRMIDVLQSKEKINEDTA